MSSTKFKDSGQRANFDTGAVRDIDDNKGRFDLLPADAIRQLARVMETGCLKYGDRNWEQGIPIRRYVDSALRHIFCVLAGMEDEPHLPMAMWNLACAIQTEIWIRCGKLPECLRHEWPFKIRLLETGGVTAFPADVNAVAEHLSNGIAEYVKELDSRLAQAASGTPRIVERPTTGGPCKPPAVSPKPC